MEVMEAITEEVEAMAVKRFSVPQKNQIWEKEEIVKAHGQKITTELEEEGLAMDLLVVLVSCIIMAGIKKKKQLVVFLYGVNSIQR